MNRSKEPKLFQKLSPNSEDVRRSRERVQEAIRIAKGRPALQYGEIERSKPAARERQDLARRNCPMPQA